MPAKNNKNSSTDRFHKKEAYWAPPTLFLYRYSSCLIFLIIFSSKILELKTASLTPSVESTSSSSLILNSSFIQSKIARRYHPVQNIKNPHVFLKLAGESGMLQHHNHRFSSSSPPPTLPPYFTSPTTINSITKTTTIAANTLDDHNYQHHYLFSSSPSQNSKLFSYTSSSSKRPPPHHHSMYPFDNNEKEPLEEPLAKLTQNDDFSSSSSASAEEIELKQKQKQDQDYYSSESESEQTGSDEVEELTPQQTQQQLGGGGGTPFYQNNLWSSSSLQSTPAAPDTTQNFNSLAPQLPSPSHPFSSSINHEEEGQDEQKNLFQFSSPPPPPDHHGQQQQQKIPSTTTTTTTNPIKIEATSRHLLLDSQQKADRRVDDIDHDLNDLLNLNPSSLYPFTLHDFENGAVADDDQISRYFIKTRPRDQQHQHQHQQEQGRTTVSVSVSPIIDFTSSPPVTISRLNSPSSNANLNGNTQFSQQQQQSSPTFLQSVTEQSNGQNSFDGSPLPPLSSTTTTKSALLDLAESQQSKSQLFDTHLFSHDMTYGTSAAAASSSLSTIPVTSTNALPTTYDKDEFTLPPGPAPSSLPLTTSSSSTDAIPGMPGIDYPILGEVPFTGFDCQKQRYKGFFADIHTKCQAWHYCDFSDGHSTFLCPNGTLFSQVLLTCDWWFNVDCSQALQLYVLNERLYRYIKPPKPSFPEDFYGPQVDLWLSQQLQLGLLPKMKKKIKDKIVIMGSH